MNDNDETLSPKKKGNVDRTNPISPIIRTGIAPGSICPVDLSGIGLDVLI